MDGRFTRLPDARVPAGRGAGALSRRQLGRLAGLAGATALVAAVAPAGLVRAQALPAFASPAFERTWKRNDLLVLQGTADRSWTWGPNSAFAGQEEYAQGRDGQRLVQYFDKARMEINDPSQPDQVTFGLLVREMVSGLVALGDLPAQVREIGPAPEAVAGDPVEGNPLAPTYASFAGVASLQADRPASPALGQRVTQTIDREGRTGTLPADAAGLAELATIAGFEPNLKHNIPDRFLDFLIQFGTVYVDGQFVDNQPVFQPWQLVMGFPITEPYWTRAVVAGRPQWVLVQLYERRALTFTPANPPGFQVEMGNVGQHYFRWRYRDTSPGMPLPPPRTALPERIIALDAPADGDGVATGARVRGRVTVAPFENTLVFRVYDALGRRIGSGPVPVTADLGAPGLYAGTLRFNPDARGPGRVEIADSSPATGFMLGRAIINVRLGGGAELTLPPRTPQRVITIDAPADGAPFRSGDRLRGRVTVGPFENTLAYRVYNSSSDLIGTGSLTVRTGAPGGPGIFAGEIAFPGDDRGPGRLEVLEIGAADGAVLASSFINVVLRGDGPPPPAPLPQRVITIDAPPDGESINSGFRIRGRVTVAPFENTLAYRVYDTGGNLISAGPLPVLPVLGEFGMPGLFDGRVIFPAGSRGAGRVEVLDLSAENGAVLAAAAINVRLGQGGPVQTAPALPLRAITIDVPAEGGTVGTVVTVRGRVTVSPFENVVTCRAYDVGGALIGAGALRVTPAGGAFGNPGAYAGEVALRAGYSGSARLEVLEINPADGAIFASKAVNVIVR
jgi:hypothetical protein